MNKCKGCQWYGKPYWSIINPCDNCPRENTNIEITTRWKDRYIIELQQRINKAIEYLEKTSGIDDNWMAISKREMLDILRGNNDICRLSRNR